MLSLNNFIMLIGFKHVGKSVIGKKLAETLHVPFIDLDIKIENSYENTFHQKYTCREIMQQHGEIFFRDLEKNALAEVVDSKPSIVSLGGGTPLNSINKSCLLIHITAPREIVFERILQSGIPAFFNPKENTLESFNRLWDERHKIYNEIKHFSVENNSSIDSAVNNIMQWYIKKQVALP